MPVERAGELHRHQVLGIATGTQAEANAALARLARGEHQLKLEPGDHVILSSRVIPGHEPQVSALESMFLRRDIRVTTRSTDPDVHVSGHASRSEQTQMIEMVRPQAFVPLHGTLHHLTRHADLARSLGVGASLVVENGQVASLDKDELRRGGHWQAGRVHLGFGRPVAGETLKERGTLAAEGVIFVAAPVSGGKLRGPVELVARGVLSGPVLTTALADAVREVVLATEGGAADDELLKETVRLAVRRAVARTLGAKTQVVVTLVPIPRPE
jgi:ribonuclease J